MASAGRHGSMRFLRWTFLALSACVGTSLGSIAPAKDLELLTRLLTPAYMVQNFAAVCMGRDARFLTEPNGETVQVAAFSEHVKNEVTSDLPESEAAQVRTMAADTALNVAREELLLLNRKSSIVPEDAIKNWCERSVRHFIFEIMSKHREKHPEFDKLLEAAKR